MTAKARCSVAEAGTGDDAGSGRSVAEVGNRRWWRVDGRRDGWKLGETATDELSGGECQERVSEINFG